MNCRNVTWEPNGVIPSKLRLTFGCRKFRKSITGALRRQQKSDSTYIEGEEEELHQIHMRKILESVNQRKENIDSDRNQKQPPSHRPNPAYPASSLSCPIQCSDQYQQSRYAGKNGEYKIQSIRWHEILDTRCKPHAHCNYDDEKKMSS